MERAPVVDDDNGIGWNNKQMSLVWDDSELSIASNRKQSQKSSFLLYTLITRASIVPILRFMPIIKSVWHITYIYSHQYGSFGDVKMFVL